MNTRQFFLLRKRFPGTGCLGRITLLYRKSIPMNGSSCYLLISTKRDHPTFLRDGCYQMLNYARVLGYSTALAFHHLIHIVSGEIENGKRIEKSLFLIIIWCLGKIFILNYLWFFPAWDILSIRWCTGIFLSIQHLGFSLFIFFLMPFIYR